MFVNYYKEETKNQKCAMADGILSSSVFFANGSILLSFVLALIVSPIAFWEIWVSPLLKYYQSVKLRRSICDSFDGVLAINKSPFAKSYKQFEFQCKAICFELKRILKNCIQ